jgi:hypothetical protein
VFSGYELRRLCAMIDVIAIRSRPVEPIAGVAMLTRFVTAAVVFCIASAASAQTAVPSPTPGAEPLRLETLVFEKSAGERHRAIRAWMQSRAQGWRHLPLQLGGNFLSERWCAPGTAERRCTGGAPVRGDASMSLETLTYEQEFPKVFGSIVSIRSFPMKSDLALQFYLAIDGRRIAGDSMTADFFVQADDREPDRYTLGAQMHLSLMGTALSVDAPGGWRGALAAMKASPASLRRFAGEMLAALDKRVTDALARGEVSGFDEGASPGRGIPPQRLSRPLKPDELAQLKAAAKQEIARRRAFFEQRAEALHALLIAAVPVDLL